MMTPMARKADGSREYRRGEGSVYRDYDAGVWVASVSLGWRDGRRIRRRVTAPSKDIARLQLARLRQTYGTAGEAALMPLGKYLDQWLGVVRPTITGSTWTSYAGHVAIHIKPLLGNITVARLRPGDVERLIAERLDAAAPARGAHRNHRSGAGPRLASGDRERLRPRHGRAAATGDG